jgi:putative tryptophan/tyrosine transport system substrate-binding protein
MPMTRRWVLGGVAASVLAPSAARAQPSLPVVGILRSNPNDASEAFVPRFRRDMSELGWRDGRNVRFVIRWANGRTDNMQPLVNELVAEQPKVLLAFGPSGMRAITAPKHAVSVVGMADDMIAGGFAESLAYPGAQVTGVSILAAELDAKRLELLCQLVPHAKRVGALFDVNVAGSRNPQLAAAAQALGVELVYAELTSVASVGDALDRLIAARVDAVNVLASTILNAAREVILTRLHDARLPAIHQWPEAAADGGLIAYGPALNTIYRQLATLTDRILRGARAADLPIEHPAKLDLVVNLREARWIGVEVPPSILLRADEVIE